MVGRGSFAHTAPQPLKPPCPAEPPPPAGPAPPGSPGAVGVFADEQRLSRAADGTVRLVPIIVIQEEAVQKLVLGEGQSQDGTPLRPEASSKPALSSLLTLHGAHIPPSNRGCCVCTWKLPQQMHMSDADVRRAPRVMTPANRATDLATIVTEEVQDPHTDNHRTLRKKMKDLSKWDGISGSPVYGSEDLAWLQLQVSPAGLQIPLKIPAGFSV